MRHICVLASSVIFGATFAAQSMAASEELQEVVVTASLRHTAMVNLPASVSVLDSETLRGAGEQHLQDVLGLVPNLNWASGTSRPRYYQLRGIGESEQWQGAPNPSVGFLIDDIDFSGIGMPATLFDLKQVEVLRGPQGTTYGANALAGLISLSSNEPTPEPERRIEASVGDFDTRSLAAIVGGALDDSGAVAGRLAAQQFRSDGFRTNAFLKRDDTNGYDETTVRGRLRWNANDRWHFLLTGMSVNLNNGYDAFSIDNSRITQSDQPGRDEQRSQAGALRIEYDGADSFSWRSATALADSRIRYSFDGDWGHDPTYNYFSRFVRQHNTQSEDLRLTSRAQADRVGSAAWVLGIYVLRVQEANDELDLFNGDTYTAIASRYRATSNALYGQWQQRLATSLLLTGGLRVEQRKASYGDTDGTAFAPTDHMIGGDLSLQFEQDATTRWYITLARGFKAGGVNIGVDVPSARRGFGPEFLVSAEVGVKGRAAADKLQWQAALFSMRRTAMQVSSSLQLRADDPLSFIYITDNASRGQNSGFEGSAAWAVNSRLNLSATLGLLQTRFVDYRNASLDLNGRDQAHAPRYQYSLAADYHLSGGFRARIDLQAAASYYFSASDYTRADARAVVSLKLGWDRQKWSAMFFGRNLFNANTVQQGYYFQNEPPDFPTKLYTQHGDPRQIGLTVNFRVR